MSTNSDFRIELSKNIADYSQISLSDGDVKTIGSIKMLHGKAKPQNCIIVMLTCTIDHIPW